MTLEILEHTADVGLQSRAASCEEAFGEIGEGLASLLGAWFPGEGTEQEVTVEASDRESLLATWVDELLYLHEVADAVFGELTVVQVGDDQLTARVRMAPRGRRELEGVGVKAATLHRLLVVQNEDWLARVYLDV